MQLNTIQLVKYQNWQSQEKKTPCEAPTKLWEVVGTDMVMMRNPNLLCIVGYYSKFLVIKKVESMLVENLIQATEVEISEFGLPKNWCQMQAQILFQRNLRIFADTYI